MWRCYLHFWWYIWMIHMNIFQFECFTARMILYTWNILVIPFLPRPSQRAIDLLAPVPGHVWRGVLSLAVVPLGGGVLRQRAHHRVLLVGALLGHLQTSLRLPSLRLEKSGHRLLPLLGHRHVRQCPSPPLHKVGTLFAHSMYEKCFRINFIPFPYPDGPPAPESAFCAMLHIPEVYPAPPLINLPQNDKWCCSGTRSTRSPSSASSSFPFSSSPSSMSPWSWSSDGRPRPASGKRSKHCQRHNRFGNLPSCSHLRRTSEFFLFVPSHGGSFCQEHHTQHCEKKGRSAKNWFGHFWVGSLVNLISMRVNCILDDFFRNTPLDHMWRAEILAQILPNIAKHSQVQ